MGRPFVKRIAVAVNQQVEGFVTDLVREEVARSADPIVVKVGTRVLTTGDGQLDLKRIAALADEIAKIVAGGRRLVLVSSGAVGAGMGRLKLARRPEHLAQLQAVAAVGQSRLIEAYQHALEPHGLHAAQVLLTSDDLNERARYLNVRNTILALFRFHAVPIINENDTVAVDELQISFGDNDQLAAMVTNLIRAPLLILLSDVEGLFDADPQFKGARLIETVRDIDAALARLEADPAPPVSGLSRGGMKSKLAAARLAVAAGENVIIADGRQPAILSEILAAKPIGTLILGKGASVTSRKRWIGLTARPRGHVVVDAGASRAVTRDGKSLLAIGILSVDGDFGKGDVVRICDEQGSEIARGLINYTASEIRRIAGRPTAEIGDVLGHRPYDEVIHRDNLARSR